MSSVNYRPATLLVHQGKDRDPATGASTVPIYQASTYHHEGGVSGEYDYARSGNPSRDQVEEAIALLEGGVRGFAYASGMAAIGSALSLLHSGDHLIASAGLYGGSWRFITGVLPQQGVTITLVDTTDIRRCKSRHNAADPGALSRDTVQSAFPDHGLCERWWRSPESTS